MRLHENLFCLRIDREAVRQKPMHKKRKEEKQEQNAFDPQLFSASLSYLWVVYVVNKI